MGTRWVSLVAAVEWHAGHRGFERPARVLEGGARLDLTVESVSSIGPAVAGLPAWRVFITRDSSERRLRIRIDADGRTSVEAEAEG